MGIVVTIALLFASLNFYFQPKWYQSFRKPIGLFVLVMGLWNFGWYGLQHTGSFWGLVALVSGFVLMVSSLYINPIIKITLLENNVVKNIIGLAVIASLALYAITLIQINLGLPIIR